MYLQCIGEVSADGCNHNDGATMWPTRYDEVQATHVLLLGKLSDMVEVSQGCPSSLPDDLKIHLVLG